MTYIVSSGALNSTHSLTQGTLTTKQVMDLYVKIILMVCSNFVA